MKSPQSSKADKPPIFQPLLLRACRAAVPGAGVPAPPGRTAWHISPGMQGAIALCPPQTPALLPWPTSIALFHVS